MTSRASARRVLSRLLTTRSSVSAVTHLDAAAAMIAPTSTSMIQLGLPRAASSASVLQTRWFSSAEGEKKEEGEDAEKKEEQEGDAEKASDDAASAGEEEETPQLSREEELEAEVKDLTDRLYRSLAEQENTRRIALRDVDSAKQFAIKSFAKSLLDVSDNLTRALEAVPEEMRHDKEGQPILANLFEGIEMTDQGLIKAFESNGLVKYGKIGDVFDPHQHEALYEYPDPDKEPGTVGQVMKPGFMLNKRVLRPAEVGVVKSQG